MTPERIKKIAIELGWQFIDHQESICMISFCRDGARVNVYYTKMTVATCLNHPTKGKTQMFRRDITESELRKIFKNPRVHLNKGYRQKAW